MPCFGGAILNCESGNSWVETCYASSVRSRKRRPESGRDLNVWGERFSHTSSSSPVARLEVYPFADSQQRQRLSAGLSQPTDQVSLRRLPERQLIDVSNPG